MVEIVCVPVIVAIVYALMSVYKTYIAKDNEKLLRFIPLIGGIIGICLGLFLYFVYPDLIVATNVLTAILVGCASGLSATGFDQIFKQFAKYGIHVKETKSEDKADDKSNKI